MPKKYNERWLGVKKEDKIKIEYSRQEIANALRIGRINKCMTLEDLAVLSSVNASTILRYERLDSSPRLDMLIRMLHFLDYELVVRKREKKYESNNDKQKSKDY